MYPFFFTIIVPTYNRAHLIIATLDSLLQQNFKDYEIIVVDDGSTDNTEELVRPFIGEKLRYYKKNNAERAAARNYGARMARGNFVNFFDSDDIAMPNHLENAAKLLEQHPDAHWFHLGYAWANTQQRIIRSVNQFKGDTLNHLLHLGNPLSCNGVFVRTTTLLANLFNEDRQLSASEDYELWCRLGARFPLYYDNNVSSLVIDHEARSVRTINGQQLITRLELLIRYLSEDPVVVQYYGSSFNTIKMDAYSYISVHLADNKVYKLKSLCYLLKALACSFYLLQTKRFYAILKNLIIKW